MRALAARFFFVGVARRGFAGVAPRGFARLGFAGDARRGFAGDARRGFAGDARRGFARLGFGVERFAPPLFVLRCLTLRVVEPRFFTAPDPVRRLFFAVDGVCRSFDRA